MQGASLHLLNTNSVYDLYGDEFDPEIRNAQPRSATTTPMTPNLIHSNSRSPVVCMPTTTPRPMNIFDMEFSPLLTGTICINEILLYILLFVEPHLETLAAVSSVCRGWKDRMEFMPQWGLLRRMLHRPRPPIRAMVVNYLFSIEEHGSPTDGILCRSDFILCQQRRQVDRRKWHTTRMFFQANSVVLGVALSMLYGAMNAAALWFGHYIGFDHDFQTDTELIYNYLLGVVSLFMLFAIGFAVSLWLLQGPYKWLVRASRSIAISSIMIPLFIGLCATIVCARLSSAQDLCDHPEIVAGLCGGSVPHSIVPSVITFANASEWAFQSSTPETISTAGFPITNDAEYVYFIMWLINVVRPAECPGKVAVFVQATDNSSTIDWTSVSGGARKSYRSPVPSRFFQVDTLAVAHVAWYQLPYWTAERFPALVLQDATKPQELLPIMEAIVWCLFAIGMTAYVVACVVVWKKLVKLVQVVGALIES